jgi:hypothetical protein
MILLNRETRKSILMVGANGHLNELGRVRLTRELFCGRHRPGQRVRLMAIAAKYGLDNEAVLKLFTEFQSLGLITLSGNFSAVLHSPNAKEMHEAYEIRVGIEEIAGRTAAALKGNSAELQKELDAMRLAVSTVVPNTMLSSTKPFFNLPGTEPYRRFGKALDHCVVAGVRRVSGSGKTFGVMVRRSSLPERTSTSSGT